MSSLKKDHPKGVITFGETKLKWADCYKYLGIEVHKNGNMIATSENLCSRAWKAIFKMKSAFKDIDVDPKLQIKMFEILARPILCYNSEIWGPFNYSCSQRSDMSDLTLFWNKVVEVPVEKFQLKFIKGLLGVHAKASNAAVMGEVGRYPIFCYIVQNILKYISHLNEVVSDRPLLAAALGEDKILPKTKSWHKRVESLLQLFGFELNNNSILKSDSIKKIKTHLQRSYEVYWHLKLGDPTLDSGKLNLYRKIKSHFRFEPYLSNIHMFKYRRYITALRISSHNLEIEKGRYVQKKEEQVERNKRYCMLCLENNICLLGDEVHAVFICPTFYSNRNKLLKHMEDKYPNLKFLNNIDKLIFFLTCENDDINMISRYIHSILTYKRPKFNTRLIIGIGNSL